MEANNKILEVLQYIGEQFGIVIDWSSENVMPYVQSLIVRIGEYEFYSSLTLAIISFIISFVLLIALPKIILVTKKSFEEDNELLCISMGFLTGISICALPITFVLGCTEVNEAIEAKFLPEVTAVRYVQEAIQGTNQQ